MRLRLRLASDDEVLQERHARAGLAETSAAARRTMPGGSRCGQRSSAGEEDRRGKAQGDRIGFDLIRIRHIMEPTRSFACAAIDAGPSFQFPSRLRIGRRFACCGDGSGCSSPRLRPDRPPASRCCPSCSCGSRQRTTPGRHGFWPTRLATATRSPGPRPAPPCHPEQASPQIPLSSSTASAIAAASHRSAWSLVSRTSGMSRPDTASPPDYPA